MMLQVLPQGEGAVVLLVACGVDESNGPFAYLPTEFGDRVGVGLELGPVALPELLPPGRVVTEPTAQFGAGGDILQPFVHGRALLAQTARPEAFHQDPPSVLGSGLLVRPLQADLRHSGPSLFKVAMTRARRP